MSVEFPNEFPVKPVPDSADPLLLADSETSNTTKVITVGSLHPTTEVRKPNDFALLLSGVVISFTQQGLDIDATITNHGLVTGNVLQFLGTDYDIGTHEITKIDNNTVRFTETFVTAGGGTWDAKKRQAPVGKTAYFMQADVSMDSPVILTPPNPSDQIDVSVLADDPNKNQITADYDPALGALFQGTGVFSFYRRDVACFAAASLKNQVRSVDIEFSVGSFQFARENGNLDFDFLPPTWINANRVTIQLGATYAGFTAGMVIENCDFINIDNPFFTPDPALTGAVIEIKVTIGQTTNVIIANGNMSTLGSGKFAYKLPTDVQAGDDSRFLIINNVIPSSAVGFDISGGALDQTDPRVTASENQGIRNSMMQSEGLVGVAGIEVIANFGVAEPLVDVTPAPGDWDVNSANERITVDTTFGTHTIDATEEETVYAKYHIDAEKTGGGNQVLEFAVFKQDLGVGPFTEVANTSISLDTASETAKDFIGTFTNSKPKDVFQLFKTLTSGAGNTTVNKSTKLQILRSGA